MNFVRGSTARPFGGSARRGGKIAATLLGVGWAVQAWATTVVVPESASHAPGAAIPLLSTAEGLLPRIQPTLGRSEAVAWQLPLAFEPADDNAPADAGFVARGPGYTVFVGSEGVLLALQRFREGSGDVPAPRSPSGSRRERAARPDPGQNLGFVAMRLEGARPDAVPRAEGELKGRVHRLSGSDASRWQTQLRSHGRVVYPSVYPGVDVAYYGRGRELEYDFIVAPGADAGVARVRFNGVRAMRVDERGDLHLDTGMGQLVQRRPEAYQRGREGRESIPAAYVLNDDGSVGFELGAYDRDRTLVIDPVLSYATFLGGSGLDQCWDIAVDDAGYAYVVGETESVRFSTMRIVSTNAFQTNYQGGLVGIAGDAFVAKLSPDASAFEWFTYLGGSDLDGAFTLALGTGNEPVVAGFTSSTNFPTTAGAFQSTLVGETNQYTGRKFYDGFVTRLKADGSGVVWSTLLGGEGEDQVIDLLLAADESVVLVGSTTSTNLPVTGPEAGTYGGVKDGFLAVLTSNGSGLSQARFIGGSGEDSAEGLALNPAGTLAHVVGITGSTNLPVLAPVQGTNSGLFDVLMAGFRLADGVMEYATYLGGTGDDYAYRVGVGTEGHVWMAGETSSTNFPVVAPLLTSTNSGFTDAILARLAPDGRTLETSSYFGGTSDDAFWDIRLDGSGNVHLAGESLSATVPGITTNSVLSTNLGLSDILIVRLGPDGVPMTSLYGGPGDELAYAVTTDSAGNSYIAGRVRSVSFPVSSTNVAQVTYGGERTDGFVMKLAYEPALAAALAADGIVLSWPAPNDGFALESAPVGGAALSQAWSLETMPVTTQAGRHSVQLPRAATNSVFRLRWVR